MSVNVFPAPSTGGGGGGSNLPEGAVAQVIQGKLTPTGYTHPEVLDAGTYLMNANGNSVIVDLPNSGTTRTISGSGTLTLTSNETNLAMTLAENFGGDPVAVQGRLPQPTVSGFTDAVARGGGLAVDPVNGNLALTRLYSTVSTAGKVAIRNASGFTQTIINLTGDDLRYIGTAIDLDGNYFIGYKTGTQYRIMKWTKATEVLSYPYVNSTWFTNGSGPAGIAVSGDGQTITMVGNNEAKAVTSVNGGSTWAEVSLPVSGSTDTTWASSKVKWQNGRFFAKGGNTGQFLTSTDGLTWNAYTIPGASGLVTSFAYDGVTFMFATGNTNLLWRTTTLGSYSSVSTVGGQSLAVTHVEFGNGKFLATQMGAASNGNHFISTDDGVSFTVIDSSTAPFTYGNRTGTTNLHLTTAPSTVTGLQQSRETQNLVYDPLYKTFVSNQWFTNTVQQYVMDLINVDATNYYKWTYNQNWNTSGTSTYASGLDAVTWSEFMGRYYYGQLIEDNSATRLVFSYDPLTQNVRTEPWFHGSQSANMIFTGTQNLSCGAQLIMPNGKTWYTVKNGSGTELWYDTISAPEQFWGNNTAVYQTATASWNIGLMLRPVIFPDGSAAFIQRTTSLSYLPNFSFSATGSIITNWNWTDTYGTYLGIALTDQNISIDTASKTINAFYNAYYYENVPYPLPNLAAASSYGTIYASNTLFFYKNGDTFITHNTTSDTVTVSFDGGFTSATYPSLTTISGIIEKQGVYYLLTTFGGSTAIATTTDFISYKLLSLTGIFESFPLFERKTGEPNSDENNPAIMDAYGAIVQLFSDPALQPDANVFVYDMNLQEL
jgi:hypothetical protein